MMLQDITVKAMVRSKGHVRALKEFINNFNVVQVGGVINNYTLKEGAEAMNVRMMMIVTQIKIHPNPFIKDFEYVDGDDELADI